MQLGVEKEKTGKICQCLSTEVEKEKMSLGFLPGRTW